MALAVGVWSTNLETALAVFLNFFYTLKIIDLGGVFLQKKMYNSAIVLAELTLIRRIQLQICYMQTIGNLHKSFTLKKKCIMLIIA